MRNLKQKSTRYTKAPLTRTFPIGLFSVLLLSSSCTREESDVVPHSCLTTEEFGMVWIEPGKFTMGGNPHYPEEGPAQIVHVDGFWISNHEVTNWEFETFVTATDYLTTAEQHVNRSNTKGYSGGGAVFSNLDEEESSEPWWQWSSEASWRNPTGREPLSRYELNLPVVQVSLKDAQAYAKWKGMDLPTEVQWEFAANSQWSSTSEPIDEEGQYLANFYQGVFPLSDDGLDGFKSRSPVGCFEPNSNGTYDMIGNVWEWTTDEERTSSTRTVIKGGSFLCSSTYCARYRTVAKQFQESDEGAEHLGFRLVDNLRPPP